MTELDAAVEEAERELVVVRERRDAERRAEAEASAARERDLLFAVVGAWNDDRVRFARAVDEARGRLEEAILEGSFEEARDGYLAWQRAGVDAIAGDRRHADARALLASVFGVPVGAAVPAFEPPRQLLAGDLAARGIGPGEYGVVDQVLMDAVRAYATAADAAWMGERQGARNGTAAPPDPELVARGRQIAGVP